MTRASLVTPIPDNVNEVLIEDEWAETWRGANFVCHQDNDWGVLMFGTDEHFAKLSRCQDVYIDGTFKSSPRPYKQFVTVHGKYLGRVVPLVMCLSTGKTVGQYRQILTHVKRKVQRVTGHRWRPQRVITDFESSLLLAIQTELPNSQSQGCYFLLLSEFMEASPGTGPFRPIPEASQSTEMYSEIHGDGIPAGRFS